MAAKAAGTTVQDMLDKYLISKLGMKNTKWLVGQNPYLAAGMETTGDDYDKFLRAYLNYEHLPKAVADEKKKWRAETREGGRLSRVRARARK